MHFKNKQRMQIQINISSEKILMKLYEKTVKRSENIPLILNIIRLKKNKIFSIILSVITFLQYIQQ